MRVWLSFLLVLFLLLAPTDCAPCNDGNTNPADGCTNGVIDDGYVCPTSGQRCLKVLSYNLGTTGTVIGLGTTGTATTTTDTCGANKVVTGLKVSKNSGSQFRSIVYVCSTVAVTATGSLTMSSPVDSPTRGVLDSSSTSNLLCPNGQVLNWFNIRPGSNPLFRGVQIWCDTLTVTGGVLAITASKASTYAFGEGVTLTAITCGSGTFMSRQMVLDVNNVGGALFPGNFKTKCSSATLTVCGDGTLTAGFEACDDGNGVSGDGCSGLCVVESGWSCPTPGAACQASVQGSVMGLPAGATVAVTYSPPGTAITGLAGGGTFSFPVTAAMVWTVSVSTQPALTGWSCTGFSGTGVTPSSSPIVTCSYAGPGTYGQFCASEAGWDAGTPRYQAPGGKCYVTLLNGDTFSGHANTCTNLGGKLAECFSATEEGYLTARGAAGGTAGGMSLYLIGARCPTSGARCLQTWTSSILSWASALPMTYVPNPASKDLNNQVLAAPDYENCLAVASPSGAWTDLSCLARSKAICEISPASGVASASITLDWATGTSVFGRYAGKLVLTFTLGTARVPLGPTDVITLMLPPVFVAPGGEVNAGAALAALTATSAALGALGASVITQGAYGVPAVTQTEVAITRTGGPLVAGSSGPITITIGPFLFPAWDTAVTGSLPFGLGIKNAAGLPTYLLASTFAITTTPACGDSALRNPPENCDDGNSLAGDGCSEFCLTEPSAPCTDGNALSGDGCTAAGQIEPGYSCLAPATLCRRVLSIEPSITVGSGSYTLAKLGTFASGTAVRTVCPPLSMIVGFEGSFVLQSTNPDVYGIGTISLRCAGVGVSQTPGSGALLWSGAVQASSPSVGFAPSTVGTYSVTCPTNTFVSGVRNIWRTFSSGASSLQQLVFGCAQGSWRLGSVHLGGPATGAGGAALVIEHPLDPAAAMGSWFGCKQGEVPGRYADAMYGATINGLELPCSTAITSIRCGDGVITAGVEECDDGNVSAAVDGCTSSCTIGGGYSCSGSPSVCTLTCGNSVLDTGEICDDGNLVANDGCSDNCAPELCNDGNSLSGDGCSSAKAIENGFKCPLPGPGACQAVISWEVPPTTALTMQGGVPNATLPYTDFVDPCGVGQAIVGFAGYTTTIQDNGGFTTLGATRAVCGKLSLSGGSITWSAVGATVPPMRGTATTTALPTTTCPPNMVITKYNGLTYVSGQRLASISFTCSAVTFNYGYWAATGAPQVLFHGTGACCAAPAGATWVATPVACPAGRFISHSATWRVANGASDPALGLTLSCGSARPITCGDGIFDTEVEGCEDGNSVPNDGCSPGCAVEPGFVCPLAVPGPLSNCTAVCGDLIISSPIESCDDGATVSGDGCSSTCHAEPQYCCSAALGCVLCPTVLGAPEASTDGGELITIVGNYFRTNPLAAVSVTLGTKPCTGAAWVSPSEVSCVTPPGSGSGIAVTVVIDSDSSGSVPAIFSYSAPFVSAMVPSSRPTGGGIVTLVGGDFGQFPSPMTIIIGADTCLSATRLDNVTVSCVAPAGVGYNLPVAVYLGPEGRPSVPLPLFSYDMPAVVSASPLFITAFTSTPLTVNLSSLAVHSPLPHLLSLAPTGSPCAGPGRLPVKFTVTSASLSVTLPPVSLGPPLRFCYSVTTAPERWFDYTDPASPVITISLCGSGAVEGLESCDDGNLASGDGCSGTCAAEPGYTCLGSPSVCSKCGDRLKNGPEECDDGGVLAGDGCAANCTVEAGFTCVPHPSSPLFSACYKCGNRILEVPEVCDDGNTVSGDSCSAVCAVESGSECIGAIGTKSACHKCGNGVLEILEGCDDGNNAPGDGCTGTCQVEAGFTCYGGTTAPSVCQNCGNGKREGSEGCDDGNVVSGDGCSNLCTKEDGFACDMPPAGGWPAGSAGAGSGTNTTTTSSTADRCYPVGCGDGKITCAEQCDDGNVKNGDGCSSACRVETGFLCFFEPSQCQSCGNGIKEGTESCDDNNVKDGDGCSAKCATEPGWLCLGAKGSLSTCTPPVDVRLVSSVTPLSSPFSGGVDVQISGTGLSATLGCLFGSAAVLVPMFAHATIPGMFACTTPAARGVSAGAVSIVGLQVVDPTGRAIVNSAGLPTTNFYYYPDPTVSDVTPLSVETAAGTLITLRGTNFVNPALYPADTFGLAVVLFKRGSAGAARRGALQARGNFTVFATLPAAFNSSTSLTALTDFRAPAVFEVGVSLAYVRSTLYTLHTAPLTAAGAPPPSVLLNIQVCQPGWVSPALDVRCTPCAVGSYQPLAGQAECQRCPVNGYTPVNGTAVCQTCPRGSDTLRAAVAATLEDCHCSAGFYVSTGNGTGVECKACKPGGLCAGQSAPAVPLPGFWADPDVVDGDFTRCTDDTACPGGAAGACGRGYKGIRCGACVQGFYLFNGRCVPCPKGAGWRFVFLGFAVVFMTALTVIITRRGGRQQQLLATFTCASSFMQIIGIVLTMNLQWPKKLKEIIGLITFPFNLNMDVVATECSMSAGYDLKYFITMTLPFFFAVELLLFYGVFAIGALFKARKAGNEAAFKSLRHSRQALVNAFILILTLLHMVLASSSLQLFDCTPRNALGQSFLDSAPAKQCYGKWWFRRVPFAVAGVILYALGIPFFIGYLSWKLQRMKKLKSAVFRRYFSSFSGKYRRELPAWESVVMIRELGVVLSRSMFSDVPMMQAVGGLASLVVGLTLHVQMRPLQEKRTNRLETALLSVCTAVLFGGILLGGSNFPPGGIRQLTVVGTVIGFIVFGFLLIFVTVVADLRESLMAHPLLKAGNISEEEAASIIVEERASLVGVMMGDVSVGGNEKEFVTLGLRSAIMGAGPYHSEVKGGSVNASTIAAGLVSNPLRHIMDGWVYGRLIPGLCKWLVDADEGTQENFIRALILISGYLTRTRKGGVDEDDPTILKASMLANHLLRNAFFPRLKAFKTMTSSQTIEALRPLLYLARDDDEAPADVPAAGGEAAKKRMMERRKSRGGPQLVSLSSLSRGEETLVEEAPVIVEQQTEKAWYSWFFELFDTSAPAAAPAAAGAGAAPASPAGAPAETAALLPTQSQGGAGPSSVKSPKPEGADDATATSRV
jgi:cysteine-rich repeat protein